MTYLLFALPIGIIILGIWISGGGQKADDSIPKDLEGPPFRIYKAVVPESPLKLMHFISQSNEINVYSTP